jgi:NADH:ubiquinone oxidoreductase subunit 5 (subunit L)/multisubunit Na+/H+ antiporter MnhA subunit
MTATGVMKSDVRPLAGIFRQARALLLVALVPALLAAAFHPWRPAWSRDGIMAAEVAWNTVKEWQGLVLVVDARPAADFARDHRSPCAPTCGKRT